MLNIQQLKSFYPKELQSYERFYQTVVSIV